MSRIGDRFKEAKQLVPYIMGGWPDMATSRRVFTALIEAGCRVVEVGVPYSDPLADGPTIQKASETALAAGTTTDSVLEMIGSVSKEHDVSPVLMVYYNLIYRYGMERFAAAARDAGVEGVIVPDLTVEECADWKRAAAAHDIDTIFLAAPTSSPARLAKIAEDSSGFIYAVSLTGVTGARAQLPPDLAGFIGSVKDQSDLPVAVGFGVSQPEQAREIARFADGVIVGSALMDLIEKNAPERVEEAVRTFASSLISAIRGN
jgi:tryptophan synthase alpha chain